MGDVLTKSHEKGGLDLGTIGSSAVLGGVLLALVIYDTFRKPTEPETVPERRRTVG
jgi:uncharacterized membrane-anchored protein